MAKKNGFLTTYNMTGILNLKDETILIESEEDEPTIVVANDIKRFDGKVVTITVTCEEPK